MYSDWLTGFKTLLLESGKTQKEIANQILSDGKKVCAEPTVGEIRKSDTQARPQTQGRLSEALGHSIDEIEDIGKKLRHDPPQLPPEPSREHTVPSATFSEPDDRRKPLSTTELLRQVREKIDEGQTLLAGSEKELQIAKHNVDTCYSTLEAINDGITIITKDRNIEYMNHIAITLWGDRTGLDYDNVMLEFYDNYKKEESLLSKCFNRKRIPPKRETINSQTFKIEFHPIVGHSGVVSKVVIHAKERINQHSLQDAHDRAQAFIETLPQGIIIFSQDKTVVRKNAKFLELSNLQEKEIERNGKGITFDDINTSASRMENAPEVLYRIFNVFEKKEFLAGECTPKDGGPKIWQELTPLFSPDGKFIGVRCELSPYTGNKY